MTLKKSVDLPYWKDFPERDTEFVRVYPTLYNAVTEDEIWTKKHMLFYVHLPFCKNVCLNCPYKKGKPNDGLVNRYLDALKKEIDNYANRPYIKDHIFDVGYFGGGTPTSLKTEQLVDLLQFISKRFTFADDIEISIETTPVDMTKEKAEALMENGIDRVSIGVQSFNNEELSLIGRNYTADKSLEIIKMLQDIGIKKINIDLLYGVPSQTVKSWEKTIDTAIDSGVTGVALYSYYIVPSPKSTIKLVKNELPDMPSDEDRDKMFYLAADKLTQAGYLGFFGDEFSKPGFKSGYVTKPWKEHLNLLGMGAWATGNVRNHWYFNEPDIEKYITKVKEGKLPYTMGAKISRQDDMRRTMVLGIKAGSVSRREFKDCYGVDFASIFEDEIKQLEEWDLVKLTDEALEIVGPKGWYYLDNISKQFYTEENKCYPQPINSDISSWIDCKD